MVVVCEDSAINLHEFAHAIAHDFDAQRWLCVNERCCCWGVVADQRLARLTSEESSYLLWPKKITGKHHPKYELPW